MRQCIGIREGSALLIPNSARKAVQRTNVRQCKKKVCQNISTNIKRQRLSDPEDLNRPSGLIQRLKFSQCCMLCTYFKKKKNRITRKGNRSHPRFPSRNSPPARATTLPRVVVRRPPHRSPSRRRNVCSDHPHKCRPTTHRRLPISARCRPAISARVAAALSPCHLKHRQVPPLPIGSPSTSPDPSPAPICRTAVNDVGAPTATSSRAGYASRTRGEQQPDRSAT